jgi:hypothetical protein
MQQVLGQSKTVAFIKRLAKALEEIGWSATSWATCPGPAVAKALGLTVPDSLVAIADELIE